MLIASCCFIVPSHTTEQTVSIFFRKVLRQFIGGYMTRNLPGTFLEPSWNLPGTFLKKIEMVWSVVWEGTQTNKQATSTQSTRNNDLHPVQG
jgi:hypothetical protein|tara:strand:+ start:552 stop:827 length:276 start_codon:yes stop_codon:yes gene_type:complete